MDETYLEWGKSSKLMALECMKQFVYINMGDQGYITVIIEFIYNQNNS